MDTKAIFVFALGILFHRGASSAADERVIRVIATTAFLSMCHIVLGYECIRRTVLSVLPSESKVVFYGFFLFIGILIMIEEAVFYFLHSFVPSIVLWVFQGLGSIFIGTGCILIISALWALSENNADINICSFIECGVYRYMRHPYYLGISIFCLGCMLYLLNPLSAIISLFVMHDKVAEYISLEEKYLEDKEKRYQEYKSRVICGIPYISIKKDKKSLLKKNN